MILELGPATFTPEGLRAGGATWLLEQGHLVSSIRFAGAWSSEKRMACYLQEGEAAGVMLGLTKSQTQRISAIHETLGFCLALPSVTVKILEAGWTLPPHSTC